MNTNVYNIQIRVINSILKIFSLIGYIDHIYTINLWETKELNIQCSYNSEIVKRFIFKYKFKSSTDINGYCILNKYLSKSNISIKIILT